jgi:hypothetical protein
LQIVSWQKPKEYDRKEASHASLVGNLTCTSPDTKIAQVLAAVAKVARIHEETEDRPNRDRRRLTAETSLCSGFPRDEGRDVVGLQQCPVKKTVAELLGDETPGERGYFLRVLRADPAT